MRSSIYLLAEGDIEINRGLPTVSIEVANTGDRAVQVGSHFHFFEVNRALRFDRAIGYGMRLDIPSGTSVRFEPGDTRSVELVAIGGRDVVAGAVTKFSAWTIARGVAALMRQSFRRHSVSGATTRRRHWAARHLATMHRWCAQWRPGS